MQRAECMQLMVLVSLASVAMILLLVATVPRDDQGPEEAGVEAVSMVHGSNLHSRVKRTPKPLVHGIKDKTKDSVNHTDRELFILAHNKARSIVNPTSNNMLFMVWNDTLEKIAQDYARECTFAHSSGQHRQGAGENIYAGIVGYHSGGAVEVWDYEKHDYLFASNTCQEEPCGHYTAVVWHHTVQVGCGIAYCKELKKVTFLRKDGWITICNYSPAGNWYNHQPYAAGPSCGDCPEDYPTCEDNLCRRQPFCGDLKCENNEVLDPKTCLCECASDPENRLGGFCSPHPNPDRSLAQPGGAATRESLSNLLLASMHVITAAIIMPVSDFLTMIEYLLI